MRGTHGTAVGDEDGLERPADGDGLLERVADEDVRFASLVGGVGQVLPVVRPGGKERDGFVVGKPGGVDPVEIATGLPINKMLWGGTRSFAREQGFS